jgi:twinkle protein
MSCKYVFLDHLSIIVSAQESGDERKALDEIMTKLRMLVQETNIALIIVSHLKRPQNIGHEEGAATSLAQLRGSGAIAQLSDMVIGLERNGQAEDLVERNTTRVRVLKNRFSGITGPACNLLYNKETGRMFEIEAQEETLL